MTDDERLERFRDQVERGRHRPSVQTEASLVAELKRTFAPIFETVEAMNRAVSNHMLSRVFIDHEQVDMQAGVYSFHISMTGDRSDIRKLDVILRRNAAKIHDTVHGYGLGKFRGAFSADPADMEDAKDSLYKFVGDYFEYGT